MTIAAPPAPHGPLDRLRWAAADSWTITLRDLIHWVNQPFQLLVGLLFPVLILLLFGYLFGGGMSIPGGGDYREFLVPGQFALTMVFGLEATFTAVSADATRGITDRFRSMPMAPSAVVGGRAAADMLSSAAGLVVMVACGLAIGWRWHAGIGAAALAFGLLLLLRFAMLWVGIYIGLAVRNPEAVMALQILVWPFGFLSNAFAAPATMPGWLGAVADWNPMSATVSATRQLFGNPGWEPSSWAGEQALWLAVAWPLLLVTIFLPLSVRRYQRLSH